MTKITTVRENFLKVAKEYFGERYKKYFIKDKYAGSLIVRNEFNRKTEKVWQKGGVMVFVGVDTDTHNRMFCAYQIINHDGTKGKLLFVDNDVVFKFQETGEPILRGI